MLKRELFYPEPDSRYRQREALDFEREKMRTASAFYEYTIRIKNL
jgi:hypothetical protein